MYKTIINPENGRKVNINSNIGIRILKNYLQNLMGGSSDTPLLDAVINVKKGLISMDSIYELLEDNNTDVNEADEEGFTSLWEAAENNLTEVVEVLLDSEKIDINKGLLLDGSTPLHIACANGHDEIVIQLIQRKDIRPNMPLTNDSEEEKGATPLYLACKYGHREVVEILLDNDIILKSLTKPIDDANNTPLSVSVKYGHTGIINLLIEHGANLDDIPPTGTVFYID